MSSKRKRSCRGRELGEDRRIPRRDFLQGALVAAGTMLSGPFLRAYADEPDSTAAQDLPGYYPPRRTGLRGSHPGSFEAAHALRDGTAVAQASDKQESYDLVIVGAGISGLAAAHFYRARNVSAGRILILDNHDDFGGHAKRNEFELAGRMHLMNGGTLEIDSPRPYSPIAEGLIRELGINVAGLSPKVEHPDFYDSMGLRVGVFLDRETFGKDYLAVGEGSAPVARMLAGSPLPQRVREEIAKIQEGSTDYLPGLSSQEKKLRLARISYRTFLTDIVKADPLTVAYYQSRTHGLWGVGIDAVSALDCWAIKMPGFKGMRLNRGSIPQMGYTPSGYVDTGGSKTLHFPDGNATIARLLVRNLVPAGVPGHTAEDVVTARVDYGRLDRPDSQVRLRLNSTVVRVQHTGDPATATGVDVTYMRNGRPQVVRANRCILACWNMMIPHLCPELPEAQKQALHELVKTPLVYTSVALRNWQPFKKLGIAQVIAPASYYAFLMLNPKVDIGAYRSSASPDEPILVEMMRTPCRPGLKEHEQNKAGRAELMGTSFADFERNTREQLARTLGPGGFDPVTDIQAITVNRWPHGYAPEYNPLFDPDGPPEQRPYVRGRARFGRITIANSDAGGAAYTDSAIDQASRAVNELLG